MNKKKLAKIVTKYLLFAGAVASVSLILSGVFESSYITVTVNWVKCLIGVSALVAIDSLVSHIFPKCCRKDKPNER